MVWMRVDYPDEPEVTHVETCHKNYRDLYKIPEIHNFLCRSAVSTPGRDPDY
jgi:hypothetical protein